MPGHFRVGGAYLYISFVFIQSDIYAPPGLAYVMETAGHGNLLGILFFLFKQALQSWCKLWHWFCSICRCWSFQLKSASNSVICAHVNIEVVSVKPAWVPEIFLTNSFIVQAGFNKRSTNIGNWAKMGPHKRETNAMRTVNWNLVIQAWLHLNRNYEVIGA